MITGQTDVKVRGAKQVTTHNSFSTLWIRAMPDNDAPVFIGNEDVSKETGYPLLPGEQMMIDKVHPHKIFVIAPKSGQRVAWRV